MQSRPLGRQHSLAPCDTPTWPPGGLVLPCKSLRAPVEVGSPRWPSRASGRWPQHRLPGSRGASRRPVLLGHDEPSVGPGSGLPRGPSPRLPHLLPEPLRWFLLSEETLAERGRVPSSEMWRGVTQSPTVRRARAGPASGLGKGASSLSSGLPPHWTRGPSQVSSLLTVFRECLGHPRRDGGAGSTRQDRESGPGLTPLRARGRSRGLDQG